MVKSHIDYISLSFDEMVEQERFAVTENLPRIGKYNPGRRQASARELELHDIFSLLALHHFGVARTVEQRKVLDLGCSLAAEFFTDSWWTLHERDIAQLSRDEGNEELQWLEPLRLSLLFAGLNSDKRLLALLASWPSTWMRAEWRAVPFPEGIEQVYFALLTQCSPIAISSDCKKISDKRLAILYGAIERSDDGILADALNSSLRLFRKHLKRKGALPFEAIAVEETNILLLWRLMKNVDLFHSIDEGVRPHILQLNDGE